MYRSSKDSWLGGVIGGIGESIGISSRLLRIIFIVLYLGIGGLTFGISWVAVTIIYFLCWIFLPEKIN